MNHTQEKLEILYQSLMTDPNKGLSDEKVIEIQKSKGLNKFEEEKKETVILKVIHHLRDFTSLILLDRKSVV